MDMGKAETRQQLADWWDSFDTRYMRPYFSRPDIESPTAASAGSHSFSCITSQDIEHPVMSSAGSSAFKG